MDKKKLISLWLFLLSLAFILITCNGKGEDSGGGGGGTGTATKQLGTTSNDIGWGVAADSSGNVYVTGVTSGGLDGNTNAGGFDIFLVKYDSNGVKQ